MRRQLLRRIWSKEYQRFDRTSSLSPPMRRSDRRIPLDTPSPEVCKECERIEEQFQKTSQVTTAKRLKFSGSSFHSRDSRDSRGSRDSRDSQDSQDSRDSLETAESKHSDNELATSTAIANRGNQSVSTGHNNTTEVSIATSVSSNGPPPSDSLDDVISATVIDRAAAVPIDPESDESGNVYYVEIDDDQIHITTASTGNSDGSTGHSMYYSSTHIESINSRSTDENDNRHDGGGDRANGGNATCDFNTDRKQHDNTNGGAGGGGNNNPGDSDTTIDEYISSLLVDNLNNVVCGRVNGLANGETNGVENGGGGGDTKEAPNSEKVNNGKKAFFL